jgi:hypothetical protein
MIKTSVNLTESAANYIEMLGVKNKSEFINQLIEMHRLKTRQQQIIQEGRDQLADPDIIEHIRDWDLISIEGLGNEAI